MNTPMTPMVVAYSIRELLVVHFALSHIRRHLLPLTLMVIAIAEFQLVEPVRTELQHYYSLPVAGFDIFLSL